MVGRWIAYFGQFSHKSFETGSSGRMHLQSVLTRVENIVFKGSGRGPFLIHWGSQVETKACRAALEHSYRNNKGWLGWGRKAGGRNCQSRRVESTWRVFRLGDAVRI